VGTLITNANVNALNLISKSQTQIQQMAKNQNLINFLNLVSKEPPKDWRKDIEFYEDNKEWLQRSAKIAIKILSVLRNNRKENRLPNSQKDLAELMGVSPQQVNKMVKGTENLTLETISKIEKALGIKLMEISETYSKSLQQDKELEPSV
jgi:plasmid maintenance system antidote protein VapI